MSEAIFGFLGVIVGAVVSLLGEQFTTRREREARQALRDQERRDRRMAFQRETILALQDAVGEYQRQATSARKEALAYERQTGGRVVPGSGEVPLPDGYSAAYVRVTMLRARIFDDDLRKLVWDLQHSYSHALSATDPKEEQNYRLATIHYAEQMAERVNVLLRELV